jgi:glycosyltransferase involved in cell wall biosynthesis
MKSSVLFIDTGDFESVPPGGTLNFAKQMLSSFGNRLGLVGITTDNLPLGRWVEREIGGETYDYFAVGRRTASAAKPLVPPRISGYLQLRRHRKAILARGVRTVFIQTHHVMLAVHDWPWDHVCFRFPGVENPLAISRYRGVQFLARPFARRFYRAVQRADCILAAADDEAIAGMTEQSGGILSRDRVVGFPTRVDTGLFRPGGREQSRRHNGLPETAVVLATCGRIHWAKGWQLLIDAFTELLASHPDAVLCFIGDGQDRGRLEAYAREKGVGQQIRVTGFLPPASVAAWLNAADVYVSGSMREGWSTVMIEALACGLPIVTTRVSSAGEIVAEGQTGYIIEGRDPGEFAAAVRKALALENAGALAVEDADRYALKRLKQDLETLFPPLRA